MRPSLLPLLLISLAACGDDSNPDVKPGPDIGSEDADTSASDTGDLDDTSDVDGTDDTSDADAVNDTNDTDDTGNTDSDSDDGPLELELTPLPAPGLVGGPLTRSDNPTQTFLSPANLSEIITGNYSAGRELFVATWTEAPDSTRPLIDGLGPLFHADSCVACHPTTGRPASLFSDGTIAEGILVRLNRYEEALGMWHGRDPYLGSQLQTRALPGMEPEATVRWVADTARTPDYISGSSAAYQLAITFSATHPAPHPQTQMGARLSPHLTGMGLLDLVPESIILSQEDPLDLNNDGISGRAARLHDGRVGRFGWKANHATLASQSAAAFANDIGITTPVFSNDDCTDSQTECLSRVAGGQPELSGEHLNHVVEFMSYLAVPAARYDSEDPTLQRGQALFKHVGCASCHTPSLTTGPSTAFPILANVTFYPYTDLLLHDMGEGLADAIAEADASPSEWRTPPLWGLGLVARDSNARFLHDGRAKTLEDAILWHGGEAEATRERFRHLSESDRAALMSFLRAL